MTVPVALALTPPQWWPDAACLGRWALMDDIDMPDGGLSVCARCEAKQACDSWARSQPPNSIHGVVGGRVYDSAYPSQRRRRGQSAQRELFSAAGMVGDG